MTENVQRTLIVLKPDAVQRAIAGELLARFERRGLRLAALRLLKVERPLAEKHYAVHQGKFFYEELVKTISTSPVVVAVLEGPNAIAVVRAMVGATRPHEAAPGTIRGDYALVGLRNLVHASDAPETAAAEIALWFPEGVVAYARDVERWMTDEGAPS
ncbi:MAG TPA: nucleoside-diphosphate kinase [Chloroflexi bacterium]|nr:nucleoside-diphosphate kinase [Chloroflexota bacterium]HAL27608.1 nucleoside-diphosphate kinase [Chloroflexota bacterium]